MTYDELAYVFQIHRSRVQQIEKRALAKLRQACREEGLTLEALAVLDAVRTPKRVRERE